MRQLPAIAWNAFMELVRQPVFLVLFTISSSICIMLASVSYFGFGSNDPGKSTESFDLKLVENGVLTVMFISGLFGAVLCASSSLAEEIRTGTALTVLSKPVGRVTFIIGKYLGLAGALVVLTYANLIGVLLASRMSYDAYGNYDVLGIFIFFGSIAMGYFSAAVLNYFLNKLYVPWAVCLTLLFMTLAFVTIGAMDKEVAHIYLNHEIGHYANFSDLWVWTDGMGYDKVTQQVFTSSELRPKATWFQGVDWSLLQASALILFALWIIAAVALLCSTRLSWMPTLMICVTVFLVGLMSDYFVGKSALGGTFVTAGDTLVWTPSDETGGPKRVFSMEPRGVQDLPREKVEVEIYSQDGSTVLQPNKLERNILTLNQSSESDSNSSRTSPFMAGEECRVSFQSLKREMLPLFIQRLLEGEVRSGKTAPELRELMSERNIERDVSLYADIIRNPEKIPVVSKVIARDIDYELDMIFPGHLSFWIYPSEYGKLSHISGEGSGTDDDRSTASVVQRGSVLAKVLYVLIPNWQLFWLADALGPGKTIPWSYVGRSLLYVLSYLGVALALAFYLFEDRELS
ncbi:MAG: ABC transporter permease [Verrucomicrobiota bacterium]|nr:ABC transporter permease [Verrucomicrobiota bacterium]